MGLKEKLVGAGYKPDCPCLECQHILRAVEIALEAAEEAVARECSSNAPVGAVLAVLIALRRSPSTEGGR
jgi:hypothetical protein